jgi:hypothetical protein
MCNDPSHKPKGITFVIEQLDRLTQGEWTAAGDLQGATWAELGIVSAINRCIGNIEAIRKVVDGSPREDHPPLEGK